MILKCSITGVISTASANYGSVYSSAVLDDNAICPVSESALSIAQDLDGYSIYEVADWFLNKESMTHKKLQKLCYYAQAWGYALNNRRFIRTDFEAWVHGPVSPALYERFKSYGYSPIIQKGKYCCRIKDHDVDFLEDIWETYGDKDGNALEALSHHELPWQEARKGYAADESCSVVISPEIMKRYYRSIYSGN